MGWDGFLKWHILFAIRSELKKNEEFAQAMADEVWLTEKQLVEEMPFFKKSWVKHKYYKLCYRQVIVTDKDGNRLEPSQVLAEIKRYFKDKVFETTIPRNVRLAEAPSHGVAIGQYDRFSKGAKAYKALADEVLERVK